MKAVLAASFMAVPLLWARPSEGVIPGPVIVQNGSRHELVLPNAMERAIQDAVPGFEPWTLDAYDDDIQKHYSFTSRQAPWAVIGDFDGDGLPDLILDGHSGPKCFRLCVWGRATAPNVGTLASRVCGPVVRSGAVLMFVAPGEQGTNFSDDTTFIYTDAYLDYIWEKAGSTWYWKGGKWNEFVSSD